MIDSDKLEDVIAGLMRRDISDCITPNVKHAEEVLTKVALLNHLAPGFMDEFFDMVIPHFAKQHHRAMLADLAQKRADEEGFGEEWRATIEAGRTPNHKGYLANTVAMVMKAHDINQNQAIKLVAAQSGREEEDIRRNVTRAKKQEKPKK